MRRGLDQLGGNTSLNRQPSRQSDPSGMKTPPTNLFLSELSEIGSFDTRSDTDGRVLHNTLVRVGTLTRSVCWVLIAQDERLELLAQTGIEITTVREIAHSIIVSGQPIVSSSSREHYKPAPRSIWLGIPFGRAGAKGALVLLREEGRGPFEDREVAIAAMFASRLNAMSERNHWEGMIERRGEELRKTEQQLEAYALDIRSTYHAERERADQLQRALGELETTYLTTVKGFAVAVEAKDAYTAGHIARVTNYGLKIMEIVAPSQARDPQYEYGFLLHDIGKLVVPDAVLGKKGPLTDEEWEIMRLHSETGNRILEGIPFLTGAKEIVYAHHEKWDGSGYPRGLKGDEIPLGALVFPIADSFDAMTSDRPYREGTSTQAALTEIEAFSGTQFWPDAVRAFLTVPLTELEGIRQGPSEWQPRQDSGDHA